MEVDGCQKRQKAKPNNNKGKRKRMEEGREKKAPGSFESSQEVSAWWLPEVLSFGYCNNTDLDAFVSVILVMIE